MGEGWGSKRGQQLPFCGTDRTCLSSLGSVPKLYSTFVYASSMFVLGLRRKRKSGAVCTSCLTDTRRAQAVFKYPYASSTFVSSLRQKSGTICKSWLIHSRRKMYPKCPYASSTFASLEVPANMTRRIENGCYTQAPSWGSKDLQTATVWEAPLQHG